MSDKYTLVAVFQNSQEEAEMRYQDFGHWVEVKEAKQTLAEDTGARIQNVFTLEEFHKVTQVEL